MDTCILTVKELSLALKVKEKTLYQWAEQKQIPSLKLNGALRFDLDDIQKWLDDCKKETQTGYNPIVAQGRVRKGGK